MSSIFEIISSIFYILLVKKLASVVSVQISNFSFPEFYQFWFSSSISVLLSDLEQFSQLLALFVFPGFLEGIY